MEIPSTFAARQISDVKAESRLTCRGAVRLSIRSRAHNNNEHLGSDGIRLMLE
jgi:hypothetical protein